MSIPFRFEVDKPLHTLTTFGIGGTAAFFIEIQQIDQMQAVMAYCHQQGLAYLILGKGSNCLFDDRGFDGVVILNKIAFCQFEDQRVSVGAGYSFSLLGVQTARKGWSGLEFASGIPGSVGGAVYMNAGASGLDTQNSLSEVTWVDEKGDVVVLKKDQMEFSYRYSCFQKRKGAIVAATFVLQPSLEARQKQLSIVDYRMRTQPYKDPSAGCVFRNPPQLSAGALIEQAGLKGLSVGGAEVSLKHANFIVNKGSATAQDVLQLAELVRRQVKEITGHDLEMEIRCIPYRLDNSRID